MARKPTVKKPEPAAAELPPVWSSEYKAMVLRGEIEGGGNG